MEGPPEPSVLRELLRYVPETGELFWRERDVRWFKDGGARAKEYNCASWNTKWAGKRAFMGMDTHGYFHGKLLGVRYLAHRIIYAYIHNIWPSDTIDHINGDKTDNRWKNLRLVTQQENNRNLKLRSNNTSGVIGVSWCGIRKKWRVAIGADRKIQRSCYRATFEEAVFERKRLEREYGYHANHGRKAIGG